MEKNNNKPKLRFPGFTDPWEQRKLGDVSEIVGGGTPSTSNPEYWNGNIDWYSPTEIGAHVYANGSVKTITQLGLEKSSAKMLPPDKTVLFTSRAGIGDMAILQRPGATNQGFQSLVLKDDIDTYFIYSMGHLIKKYAEKNASGSTFLEISGKALGNMPILVPLINEQTQIGTFFKSIDKLITLHQRKLNHLQDKKKNLSQKMFPKNGKNFPELRFPEFTDPWEQRKLGDVTNLLTGYSFESKQFVSEGIPLIRGMNVKRNYLDMSKHICKYWHSYNGLEEYLLEENDILIQMDGALIGKSYARIEKNQLPALLVQRVTRVRSKGNEIDNHFIYQAIQQGFLRHIRGIKTETAVPHLSLNDIRNFPIMIPKYEEQIKIGAVLNYLDNLIILHQRKLNHLQEQKKALLQQMFV